MYSKDQRVVVTLDAGGINFDFSAIQGNEIIVEPITKPSHATDLDLCMNTLIEGFSQVIAQLKEKPVAISFAFPGPADYPNGIIGGFLPNFPSFRDGVALGPFLAEKFGIPVYINNDADLFVYGEALAGALPEVNARLKKTGSDKVYHNLIGFTWGTGFGFGLTVNGNMHIGDNSCCEVYCLPDRNNPNVIVEESVSVRAVKRVYGEKSGKPDHGLEPFDIFNIAEGVKEGDREAAQAAFSELGKAAGEIIANAVTLMDGIVVIGGGLTKAHKYIMPSLLNVMRSEMHTLKGETLNRLQFKVYDLNNEHEFLEFAKGDFKKIKVYGSDKMVTYDPQKRIGVTISKLGALKAVALGAYAFALHDIDIKKDSPQ